MMNRKISKIKKRIMSMVLVLAMLVTMLPLPAVQANAEEEEKGYITFSSDTSFTLSSYQERKTWDGNLYYSLDEKAWEKWDGSPITAGFDQDTHRIHLRGKKNTYMVGEYDIWNIYGTGVGLLNLDGQNIRCDGNVENLLDYQTVEEGNHPQMADYCYNSLFAGCEGLISAPEFPAPELTMFCYGMMFYGCTSLQEAPQLPATKLSYACYESMFYGCSSLVEAPELPVTTLADYCYSTMFEDCTSLKEAPELPAATLAVYCYFGMFSGCTALEKAPQLPATELMDNCYERMFADCISLKEAPKLPADTLVSSCYKSMFYGCTGLTQTPKLPATKWTYDCCDKMFYGCTGLTRLPWLHLAVTEDLNYTYMDEMFYGCTGIKVHETRQENTAIWSLPQIEGNIYSNSGVNMLAGTGGTFTGDPQVGQNYYVEVGESLAFTSAESFDIATYNQEKTWDGTLYYSTDGMHYEEWDGSTLTAKNSGDGYFVYLKGADNTRLIDKATVLDTLAPDGQGVFVIEGSEVSGIGNIETLLDAEEVEAGNHPVMGEYAFANLFAGCSALSVTPSLEPLTLSVGCYANMFYNCINLIQAPKLPATTLAESCYYGMFSGCSRIKMYEESQGNTSMWSIPEEATAGDATMWNKDIFANTGGDFTSDVQIGTIYHMADKQYVSLSSPESFTLGTYNLSKTWDGTLYYSTDSVIWNEWDGSTITSVQSGGKYYIHLYGADNTYMISETAVTNDLEPAGGALGVFALSGNQVEFNGSVEYLLDSGSALQEQHPPMADYSFAYLFAGCTTLTKAPSLPATTLSNYCYKGMFAGCTGLSVAAQLPATTLAEGCYEDMYSGCTAISAMPDLSGTTLSKYCYRRMFAGCTGLVTPKELPAATMAESCYEEMFYGCTGLTKMPELPGTTLAKACYKAMFKDCITIPESLELPAETLAESCYEEMFAGCEALASAYDLTAPTAAEKCYYGMYRDCINLKTTPQLEAAVLAPECYAYIFAGCTKLTGSYTLRAEILTTECYYGMFEGCTGLVAVAKMKATQAGEKSCAYMYKDCVNLKHVEDLSGITAAADSYEEMFVGCTRLPDESESGNYLTFSSANSFTLRTYNKKVNWDGTMYYSTNAIDWDVWQGTEISAADNGVEYVIYLRGDSNTRVVTLEKADYLNADNSRFVLTGTDIACQGNIETLLDYDMVANGEAPVMAKGCFTDLFYNCAELVLPPQLPAVDLSYGCYTSMFLSCRKMVVAPKLPATQLTDYCYEEMFMSCQTLLEAPQLPALEATDYCYDRLFSHCYLLKEAPQLPADYLKDRSYQGMFACCYALEEVPELPAMHLGIYCYRNMFTSCRGLEKAPELPAQVMAGYCYQGMFSNCINLKEAPELNAMTLNVNCYDEMFINCESLTKAPELPATTTKANCYNSMFRDCVNLTEVPELPATNAAAACYGFMFAGCTALEEAQEILPAETAEEQCYYGMYEGCTNLKTVPQLPATTLESKCYQEMFYECDSITTAPVLNATVMATDCYNSMFYSCDNLVNVQETLPAMTLAHSCYEEMYRSCINLETAPYLPATTMENECYYYMFAGCTKLVNVQEELPATTLAESCYRLMYAYADALADAPALPALTLPNSCYEEMFKDCDSLVVAPDIPATTVGIRSCHLMFQQCRNLETGPKELPALVLAEKSYQQMFYYCVKLTKAPEIKATTMGVRSCDSMFYGCDSLSEVQEELPATTLADNCYESMYRGCDSLETMPKLPATTLAPECYYYMFAYCNKLTNVQKLEATQLANGCYKRMFDSCIGLLTAPELPATTLAANCYSDMFSGCTKLKEPMELPAKVLEAGCYSNMFSQCKSLQSLPVLEVETLANSCLYRMFYGCASISVYEREIENATPWVIPAAASPTTASSWNKEVFAGTSGEFTGNPLTGVNYYTHDHEYVYRETDNVIYETCQCNHSATVQISTPGDNLIYNGGSYKAKITYSDNWQGTVYSDAEYTKNTLEGGAVTDREDVAKAVNAGNYTAKLTYGTEEISVDFSIGKVTPVPVFPNDISHDTVVLEGETSRSATLGDVDLSSYEVKESEENICPGIFKWDDQTTILTYGDAEYTMTFYPTDSENYNTVSAKVNVEGLDVTPPKGTVTIDTASWDTCKAVDYTMFRKVSKTVTATGTDTESGVAGFAYYLAKENLTKEELVQIDAGQWTAFTNSFTLEPVDKYIVYVKITDTDGNEGFINTSGIVLYQDSEKVTEELSYTKTDTEDIMGELLLNGNEVEKIVIRDGHGENATVPETAYTVEDRTTFATTVTSDAVVVLKAEYLDTLAADTYTLDISYKPLGETYVEAVVGEETAGNINPAITQMSLTVLKKDVAVPSIDSKEFSDTVQVAEVEENSLYRITENEGGTDVGIYPVVLELVNPESYQWMNRGQEATVRLDFEITPTINCFTKELTMEDWNQGDKAKLPSCTAKYGEVTYSYYDSEKQLLEEIPTTIGEYYVKAHVAADGDNYDAIESDYVAFRILKAEEKEPDDKEPVATTKPNGGNGDTIQKAEEQKTGDEAPVGFMVMLAIISVCAIIYLKRKETALD